MPRMSMGEYRIAVVLPPPRLRAIVALAIVAFGLPAATARGEERPAAPRCDYPAFVPSDDEGLRAVYEGVRLGLEQAQLARVCIEEAPNSTEARVAFGQRWRAKLADAKAAGAPPLVIFALGDQATRHLVSLSDVPHVVVVERLAVAGRIRPIDAPPTATPARSVVVAQVDAERVGELWKRMSGVTKPRVFVHPSTPAAEFEAWKAFVRGAGAEPVDKNPHVVMCPRSATDFANALQRARTWKIPLVSNDPARFGHGAVVVFGSDYAQVGRTAADAARRLITRSSNKPHAATVRGIRVHVDLEAADRSGVELPLAFLASADRIRPGIQKRDPGK